MIRGIGTSKGIGMGRALIVESPQMEISVKKIEDTAAEQERYKKAKAQFIEETQQMIEQLKQRLGEKDKTALILQLKKRVISILRFLKIRAVRR